MKLFKLFLIGLILLVTGCQIVGYSPDGSLGFIAYPKSQSMK